MLLQPNTKAKEQPAVSIIIVVAAILLECSKLLSLQYHFGVTESDICMSISNTSLSHVLNSAR